MSQFLCSLHTINRLEFDAIIDAIKTARDRASDIFLPEMDPTVLYMTRELLEAEYDRFLNRFEFD